MYFLSARFVKNTCCIFGSNAASRHDNDALSRQLNEFLQKGYSSFGRSRLARGEDSVKAEVNNGLQGLLRLTTEVESTMERHADGRQKEGFVEVPFSKVNVFTFCGINEASASVYIDVSIGRQSTNNDSIGSCSPCCKNIVNDDILLYFGVKEIAASRTDQDILLWSLNLHSGLNQTDGWRKAAFVKARAEFDAPCPTLCGVEHGRYGTGTDFERFHRLLTLYNQ